jgi:hypothetical protein
LLADDKLDDTKWTKAVREMVDAEMKRFDDYQNILAQERYDAELKGKLERSEDIARNLIGLGLDNETINKGTELSIEDIEKLRHELNKS